MASGLIELLDRYRSAVADLGLPVDWLDEPGLSRDEVSDRLHEVGLVPSEEIVDLYSWSSFRGARDLFYEEYPRVFEFDDAVDFYGHFVESGRSEEVFDPAPESWFPFIYLDEVQFLTVELSDGPDAGRVDKHVHGKKAFLFTSISEAVESALYCVEAGLHELRQSPYGPYLHADRRGQPGTADRDNPPWVGFGS